MIYTVTLNAVIDKIITVNNFTVDGTFTSDAVQSVAAGKGISVARAAKAAGGEVVAIAFVGSEDLSFYVRSLGEEGIPSFLIPVSGRTRTNTTVLDPLSMTVTHIRERGLVVDPAMLNRLILALEGQLKKGDLLVLSGSLPQGLPDDSYGRLVGIGKRGGAATVLDTSREPLRRGMNEGPYMVKPNSSELEEISGVELKREEDIIEAAMKLNLKGIELVAVSRGQKGVIVAYRGKVWSASVGLDRIVNTVGCGDALVGGMAVRIAEGGSIEEVIRTGVACAAANALTAAPGFCRPEDIERLVSEVELRRLRV
jgi:1-phosphofructokinase family hexose kinase